MSTLLIIGAVQALFLSFLILTKKKKILPDYWLTGFLVLLFIVFSTVYWSLKPGNKDLRFFLINVSLLVMPFFFIYIATLIDEKHRFKKIYLVHFIPYLGSLFYYDQLFKSIGDPAFSHLFLEVNPLNRPFGFNMFYFLEFLIIPIYLVWVIVLLKRHRLKIQSKFSSLENIDLRWIRYLLIALFGIWLATNGPMVFSDQLRLITEENALKYGFGLAVFFIFYLSFQGFKQTDTFSEARFYNDQFEPGVARKSQPAPSITKYLKSGLKEEEADRIYRDLLRTMEVEKPFLNHQLSMLELAKNMNVSTHNLSQVLNEKSGKSFYDFVNDYRVREFKQRVGNPEHKKYTLLGLAFDCGFNSKASFNRIFKKFTAQTPSQYLREIKANPS